MRIEITDDDFLNPQKHGLVRAAAFLLLQCIGDIPENETAPADATPFAHVAATAAAAPVATGVADATPTNARTVFAPPVPPPPKSDVPPPPQSNAGGSGEAGPHVGDDDADEGDSGNVPPPPPPNAATAGSNTSAASTAASTPGAQTAAGAVGVASAEVDSAGLQYDARIHQKAKGKKKDGTWKLIKGVDSALVQTVTAELAACKAVADTLKVPLPPTSTPPVGTSVPVPPSPNAAPASGVPAPNTAGSSVPIPPTQSAAGPVGAGDATPYRKLIDKITDLTKANKITPAKVMELCQSHGAPSLMALKGMQDNKSVSDPALTVCQAVDRDIDAAALGLL